MAWFHSESVRGLDRPLWEKGTIRRKSSKLRYAYCSKAQCTLHTKKNRTFVTAFVQAPYAITHAPFRARLFRRAEILWCNTRGGNAHNYEDTLLSLQAVNRLRSHAKRQMLGYSFHLCHKLYLPSFFATYTHIGKSIYALNCTFSKSGSHYFSPFILSHFLQTFEL